MARTRTAEANGTKELPSITSLSVEGFKSIDKEQTIEIRPLTILAGANSSGKSSLMQPLLLLKQTLEATYDPGPLKIDGPNVAYTKVGQFLCKANAHGKVVNFVFGIGIGEQNNAKITFQSSDATPLEFANIEIENTELHSKFVPGNYDMSILFSDPELLAMMEKQYGENAGFKLTRSRFYLNTSFTFGGVPAEVSYDIPFQFGATRNAISRVIHVPGLRGNPRRNYAVASVGEIFPGLFENYVASIILHYNANLKFATRLNTDLLELELTSRVEAVKIDDTQVDIQVGRLLKPAKHVEDDLVSIADVGFGVSQVLPVVVALLVAKPGQLVYIEQPEIHLHPRSQHAMAKLIARAAIRGVKVVIETHSSILLLGIQSLIALGELDPKIVVLHWCQRDPKTGLTKVTSADLDEAGSFGDWPEDFDDVSLEAQMRFLDAAEKKLSQ